MAKSFRDIDGETVVVDKYEMQIDFETVEDILTDEISKYIVKVKEYPYEVTEDVFEALKKYVGV